MSVHLLLTIDGWLGQLFNDDHIDETVRTLASVEQDELNTAGLLEARRTIEDCDKRIGNLEIACETTNDADTIAEFSQRIERIKAERKGAEIRLRRLTSCRRGEV